MRTVLIVFARMAPSVPMPVHVPIHLVFLRFVPVHRVDDETGNKLQQNFVHDLFVAHSLLIALELIVRVAIAARHE